MRAARHRHGAGAPEHAPPRPLDWRWLAVGVLAVDGATLLPNDPGLWIPQDWGLFQQAPRMLADGSLYQAGNFVWAPLAALLLVPFVAGGYGVWFALHALSLLALPTRVALGVLASLPFWSDSILGNTAVFVAVAGFAAFSGSSTGAFIYVALCVLIPRPMQLPLALWLLRRTSWLVWPAVAMGTVTIGFSAWTGLLDDWLLRLVPFGGENVNAPANIGPTAIFGAWWYVAGLPLAVWLSVRGWLGLAGLAIAPYVWPTYLLLLLWCPPLVAYRDSGDILAKVVKDGRLALVRVRNAVVKDHDTSHGRRESP